MSTPRFGLSQTPDLAVLDALLAAVEVHDHTGGDRLADPSGPGTATLSTTGGLLPAGGSLYYRYALVDQYGFETAASPELVVPMPARVNAPPAPQASPVVGGALTAGTYYFFLSALGADSEETPLSGPTLLTLTAGNGQAQVTGPALSQDGVTGYQVWRQGPGEGGPSRTGTFAPGGSFADDGAIAPDPCPCDPGNLPPQTNTINATSSVTITLAESDAATLTDPATPALSWRLYRSPIAGVFTNASLAATIFGTDTDPIPTSHLDTGSLVLGAGGPLETSRTLTPSQLIVPGDGSSGGPVSGGSSGGLVQNPILRAPDGRAWGLDAAEDGGLLTVPDTTYGTAYNRGHGPVLTAPDGGSWQVSVDELGALSTFTADPGPYDPVTAAAAGPLLHVDGQRRFRLGVDTDGALLLTPDQTTSDGDTDSPQQSMTLTDPDGQTWSVTADESAAPSAQKQEP